MISDTLLNCIEQNIYGQHNIGVFACDEIEDPIKNKPCAFVLNTDPHYRKGQHWVAIYINSSKEGFYFDSYGLPPLKEEFLNFLSKNCKRWYYNDVRLQDVGSKACGQFCLYFLIHMSYGWLMDDITDTLKNQPDKYVLEYVKIFCRK